MRPQWAFSPARGSPPDRKWKAWGGAQVRPSLPLSLGQMPWEWWPLPCCLWGSAVWGVTWVMWVSVNCQALFRKSLSRPRGRSRDICFQYISWLILELCLPGPQALLCEMRTLCWMIAMILFSLESRSILLQVRPIILDCPPLIRSRGPLEPLVWGTSSFHLLPVEKWPPTSHFSLGMNVFTHKVGTIAILQAAEHTSNNARLREALTTLRPPPSSLWKLGIEKTFTVS